MSDDPSRDAVIRALTAFLKYRHHDMTPRVVETYLDEHKDRIQALLASLGIDEEHIEQIPWNLEYADTTDTGPDASAHAIELMKSSAALWAPPTDDPDN